jgi:hypothetical protein
MSAETQTDAQAYLTESFGFSKHVLAVRVHDIDKENPIHEKTD